MGEWSGGWGVVLGAGGNHGKGPSTVETLMGACRRDTFGRQSDPSRATEASTLTSSSAITSRPFSTALLETRRCLLEANACIDSEMLRI